MGQQKQASDNSPQTFLGISVADVLKIILGGVLCSIPTGLVVWLLANRTPHLYVQVLDSMLLEGEQNRLGIVDFKVTNDGNKDEHVECNFALDGCPIREITSRPDSLHTLHVTTETKGDKGTVKIPRLNVGEFVEVRAVAGNPEKLPKNPVISVNGGDVVGVNEPRGLQLSRSTKTLIFTGFAYAVLIAVMSFLTNRMTRRMTGETRSLLGSIRQATGKADAFLAFLCVNLLAAYIPVLLFPREALYSSSPEDAFFRSPVAFAYVAVESRDIQELTNWRGWYLAVAFLLLLFVASAALYNSRKAWLAMPAIVLVYSLLQWMIAAVLHMGFD